jgi:gamma-glutamyltranspeptidase/glutathione hydrolase
MSLEDILEPAIGYASNGHPLLDRASATIATVRDLFLTHWPTSAALWLDRGNTPAPGVIFRNPTLASTYRRILREASTVRGREAQIDRARKIWSEGFVAEAIDRFCLTQEVMDVSGRAHRGVLSGADMAAWSATSEEPIGYDYGRYRVLKPGPGARGLSLCNSWRCSRDSSSMNSILRDRTSSIYRSKPPNLLSQTGTLSMATQTSSKPQSISFYRTPTTPNGALISDQASFEQRPGSISGFGRALETKRSAGERSLAGAGEPTVGRLGESRGDTVHFDVVDRFGNMVSATPSGGWLQSSPAIPELGFCLGSDEGSRESAWHARLRCRPMNRLS